MARSKTPKVEKTKTLPPDPVERTRLYTSITGWSDLQLQIESLKDRQREIEESESERNYDLTKFKQWAKVYHDKQYGEGKMADKLASGTDSVDEVEILMNSAVPKTADNIVNP